MTVAKRTVAASTGKPGVDSSTRGSPKRAAAACAVAVWIGAAVAGLPVDEAWRLAGVAIASALMGWARLRLGQGAAGSPQVVAGGADELARHIVPVWQHHVEAARQASERSRGGLLERLATVSSQMDAAFGAGNAMAALEVGAADLLVQRRLPEIERLCQAPRLAASLKDAMSSALADTGELLSALTALADEVQAIGRATHVLALNASVEVVRAGSAGGGFAVVAQDVRQLAGRSRAAGLQIAQQVLKVHVRIQRARLDAARLDTDDDEIVRRSEQPSRETVIAVLGSVADLSRASRTLRATSRSTQTELQKISMSLQSPDRLSQMLTSAADDMGRYSRWLAGAPDPAAAAPSAWLERLATTCTTEDLRSARHDPVRIERAPAVGFV